MNEAWEGFKFVSACLVSIVIIGCIGYFIHQWVSDFVIDKTKGPYNRMLNDLRVLQIHLDSLEGRISSPEKKKAKKDENKKLNTRK